MLGHDFCRNSGGNAALWIFPSDSLPLFSFTVLVPHNSVLVNPKKIMEGIIANPIKGQLHSFEKSAFEIRTTACYSPGIRNCCFLQSWSHRHLLLWPTSKSRCTWEGCVGSGEWIEYPRRRKAWFCIALGRKVGLFMQPVTLFFGAFPWTDVEG